MKETKVYVNKMPESCVGCKHFAENRRQCNLELCLQWSEEKQKYNDCPLKSLHEYKKELVAKVFEKIKSKFNYYELVDEIKEEIDFDKMKNYILDRIQKEFEK